MSKKRNIPQKYQAWIDARKKHKLSHAQIQMARELGMNPRNFGKIDNHNQEPWKLALGEFIKECYLKRFGSVPRQVRSIEEIVELQATKKAKKREAKLMAKANQQELD